MRKTKILIGIAVTAALLAGILIPAGNRLVKAYDGEGTAEYPYRITNCTGLQSINANLSAHYVLMQSFDCTGVDFSPIGDNSNKFTGSLDGRGNTVSNLTINRSSTNYVGIFGATGTGAEIKNLTLTNITVTGNNYVGILAGSLNGTNVSFVTADGTANGTGSVGGLFGPVDTSTINGVVLVSAVNNSGGWTGGFAAMILNSDVLNVSVDTNIVGVNSAGGLTSYMAADTADVNISDVFISGLLDDQNYRAGLASNFGEYNSHNITVTNAAINFKTDGWNYALYARNDTPGLLPTVSGVYYNSHAGSGYPTGCSPDGSITCNAVNGDGSNSTYFDNFTHAPFNSFDYDNDWDVSEGGDLVLQPQSLSLLNPLSLAGAPTSISAEPSINHGQTTVSWTAPVSSGHAELTGYKVRTRPQIDGEPWSEVTLGTNTNTDFSGWSPGALMEIQVAAINSVGTGPWSTLYTYSIPTNNTPEISNCEELQGVAFNPSGSYTLLNDIDCSETTSWNGGDGFMPIQDFEGEFDGQGYKITNLIMIQPGNNGVGLFNNVLVGAHIHNFNMVDSLVVGNSLVGPIAGEVYGGTIDHVAARSSEIYAAYLAGGAIGYTEPGGSNIIVDYVKTSGQILPVTPEEPTANIGGVIGGINAYDTESTFSHLSSSTQLGNFDMMDSSQVLYQAGGIIGSIESYDDSVIEISNSKYTGDLASAQAGGVVGEIYTQWEESLPSAPVINISNSRSVNGNIICFSDCAGIVGTTSALNGASVNVTQSMTNDDIIVFGGDSSGGILGQVDIGNTGSVTVQESYSSMYMENYFGGGINMGGIVGFAGGDTVNIENSYSNSEIHGYNNIGGIVGYTGGSIINSYATGSITGVSNVGGIAGELDDGTIQNSFVQAYVQSDPGQAFGMITASNVTDINKLTYDYYDSGAISNSICTSVGDITGHCMSVNEEGSQPNYFFNNDSNAPFREPVDPFTQYWNFDEIWQTRQFETPVFGWGEGSLIELFPCRKMIQ